jgi:hypothetical protein
MRAFRPLILASTVALALAGCGPDNGNDGGSGGSGTSSDLADSSESTPSETAPDEYCTSDHPHRIPNAGSRAGLFRICINDDGSSVRLTNTSSMVLIVRGHDLADLPSMTVVSSQNSFKARAVVRAVPSGCENSADGPCLVIPNANLTAEDTHRVALDVDVDTNGTVVATAAASAAGYVEGKLENRAQGYRSAVTACAQSAVDYYTQSALVEDAVRNSFALAGNCKTLVQKVAQDTGLTTPAPAEAGDDVLRFAGKYSSNLRRDVAAYEVIHVIARLRR